MTMITKVVFPLPPPTTNDLSSHQRTQLLRKAKKLEQIFGATPCMVDNHLEPNDPIHITFSRRPSQRRLTKTCRGSIDSTSSSTSSCESPSSSGEPSPFVSCSMRSINSYYSRASTPSPVNSVNSFESWPGKVKSPAMRLVMKEPTLETIQAPLYLNNTDPALQSLIDLSSDDTQFVDEDSIPYNPTVLNSHNIASLSSLRKQKMDRLRRKLGQNVPFDLVFPSDADSGPSNTTDLSADVQNLPIRRSRKSSPRISTARDSIVGSASVHRARRHAPSTSRPTSTHNKSDSTTSEPRILSFIIESPDEHGVGCSEEFGHSRISVNDTPFKSEWIVSTGETEVRLWSTRRGYEGWHATSSSKTALQIPPPSPLLSNTQSEPKKKPSSYRKPVPPIPIDCC